MRAAVAGYVQEIHRAYVDQAATFSPGVRGADAAADRRPDHRRGRRRPQPAPARDHRGAGPADRSGGRPGRGVRRPRVEPALLRPGGAARPRAAPGAGRAGLRGGQAGARRRHRASTTWSPSPEPASRATTRPTSAPGWPTATPPRPATSRRSGPGPAAARRWSTSWPALPIAGLPHAQALLARAICAVRRGRARGLRAWPAPTPTPSARRSSTAVGGRTQWQPAEQRRSDATEDSPRSATRPGCSRRSSPARRRSASPSWPAASTSARAPCTGCSRRWSRRGWSSATPTRAPTGSASRCSSSARSCSRTWTCTAPSDRCSPRCARRPTRAARSASSTATRSSTSTGSRARRRCGCSTRPAAGCPCTRRRPARRCSRTSPSRSSSGCWPRRRRSTQMTPKSVTDPAVLRTELARIRARGWSEAVEEREIGVASIAAPIRDTSGRVVAAISIGGPAARMGAQQRRRLAEVVVEAGEAASRRLGWSPETLTPAERADRCRSPTHPARPGRSTTPGATGSRSSRSPTTTRRWAWPTATPSRGSSST